MSSEEKSIELNGFDETGTVGRNLRFVRVGLNVANELRPFVYNLLHFGTITVTKNFLRGQSDERKISYVRMILNDPAIQATLYTFTSDHQVDVLRQFSMLEEMQLFKRRQPIVLALQQGDERAALENIAEYLKRYERSPFWLESFIKSYGFRMVIGDLIRSSKVLRNPKFINYRVISYVDGGFPFVFWWQQFLSLSPEDSRFSINATPVFGITKGDEYYPVTSMAGNIAYITSNVPGMIYPHNIIELPRMSKDDLNSFYDEYSRRVSRPTFLKRVLFVGDIPGTFQYTIPYILHRQSGYREIYEPFRLEPGRELRTFFRTFGYYPQNDLIMVGRTQSSDDRRIISECDRDSQLKTTDARSLVSEYRELASEIEREASGSNLTYQQFTGVSQALKRYVTVIENWAKNHLTDGDR